MDLGTILSVTEMVIGDEPKCKELVNLLSKRIGFIGDKQWLRQLEQRFGDLRALKPLKITCGVPGYPNLGLWGRLMDRGIRAELVVAEQHLLFCVPMLSVTSAITPIALEQINNVATDRLNGSTLIIKTSDGTIKCETVEDLGARPISKIIRSLLSRTAQSKEVPPQLLRS